MNKKLNVLPKNPEQKIGRFPSWLHRKLPSQKEFIQTSNILKKAKLPTVCEEAKCPNRFECYSRKTATFLVMGSKCTRACGFCDIDFSKNPLPLQEDEASRIASSVESLGLKHVVITQVARDDLPLGGAEHLATIIDTLQKRFAELTIEVLTSDFEGNEKALDIILEKKPTVFNHNIETIERLTPRIRHKATFNRSLSVLSYVAKSKKSDFVKSGLMVGLGETKKEVVDTLQQLKDVGCDVVTIGQYLQPSKRKLIVKDFVHPDTFKYYEQIGLKIGLRAVYSGPFIRSSYNADLLQKKLQNVSPI